MVLVALLFLPCVVLVTTVALPILLFVIAVIAIPILLYYERRNSMQKYRPINSSMASSSSPPPPIGVPTSTGFHSKPGPSASTSTLASSFNKKTVRFQVPVCNDEYSQPNDFVHQRLHVSTSLCKASSIVWSTESLLRQRRRKSRDYCYNPEPTSATIMDDRYQYNFPHHRPEHLHHYPVCVR